MEWEVGVSRWKLLYTTTVPTHLEPMLYNKRSHLLLEVAIRSLHTATKSCPPRLAATRESPGAATKTQYSQLKERKKDLKKTGKSLWKGTSGC